jgi:hypothetical protein
MAEPASPRRAALYVDFDNVFIALARWDERAAYAFGERPDAWLAWLEGRDDEGRPTTRRTLVRRCYLNPGGNWDFQMGRAVARYRAAKDLRNRTYFSEFRANFVAAGFDVVDCPPVAYLKNTADMKMALDIREALDHPTRFDEFVLLSGDSDFLPALARLRAHDRRITILAQSTAKRAYLAAADQVVGLDEFADEGMGSLPIAQAPNAPALPPAPPAAPPPAPRAEPNGHNLDELRAAALAALRDALARSSGAVRMPDVGQFMLRAFPSLRHTNYAGAGSLGALIEDANDPHLALSGPPNRRWLYDPERGPPPGDLPPGVEDQPPAPSMPEPAAEEAPATEAAAPMPAELPPEPVAGPPPALPEPAALPPEPLPPEPLPPAPPPPSPEELMAEAALLVRDLLWGTRDAKGLTQDLPALAPAEIAFILGAIAARQPLDPAEINAAAAAIAAEAAADALHVSAREVTAIMRWLMRGFARLHEAPPPDAALRLSRVLYATLVNAVRAAEEQLSEAERAALRDWTQAGAPVTPP